MRIAFAVAEAAPSHLLMVPTVRGLLSPSAQALCIPLFCKCTVATSNLAFGTQRPTLFGTANLTSGIKIECGGVEGLLIPFSIALSSENSSRFANRRRRDVRETLNSDPYTAPSFTTIWGDSTGFTQIVSGSVGLDPLGLAPTQTFWIYRRVQGRQLRTPPRHLHRRNRSDPHVRLRRRLTQSTQFEQPNLACASVQGMALMQ
jgi:spore coat protein U-like protein